MRQETIKADKGDSRSLGTRKKFLGEAGASQYAFPGWGLGTREKRAESTKSEISN